MKNRKMCKYCRPDLVLGEGYYCEQPNKHDKDCPKNANSKCQIIPKKPATVTVKGWARLCITQIGQEVFHSADTYKHDGFKIPCTITYRLPRKGAR